MFLNRAEWKARSAARAQDAARLKDEARDALALGPEDSLAVNEIACRDPGCPDVETVFLVMRRGEATRALKIAKPMAEVMRADILAAWQDPSPA